MSFLALVAAIVIAGLIVRYFGAIFQIVGAVVLVLVLALLFFG